ncbi:MAG: hypothetical protein AAGE03_03640 [Pseudomonadota bacterium]
MTAYYESFHELVVVTLHADGARSRTALHDALQNLRFEPFDYFYGFPRDDPVKAWQAEQLLHVEACIEGAINKDDEAEEIMAGTARPWTDLRVEYLLASLPITCIDPACDIIEAVAEALDLSIRHQGADISLEVLRARMTDFAREVSETHFDPGSHELCWLIESTYPAHPT